MNLSPRLAMAEAMRRAVRSHRYVVIDDHAWRGWVHTQRLRPNHRSYPRASLIYALVDPRNGRPFYVGCSVEPRRRLKKHIDEARRGINGGAKEARITDILTSGLRVELRALETQDETTAAAVENWWIAGLASFGADLTNVRGAP